MTHRTEFNFCKKIYFQNYFNKKFNKFKRIKTQNPSILAFYFNDYNLNKSDTIDFRRNINQYSAFNKLNEQTNKSYIHRDNFNEINRWVRLSHGTNSPVRLIKLPISNQIELHKLNVNQTIQKNNDNVLELLRFRFNDEFTQIMHKPFSHNNFLIIRQKRYKRIKFMPKIIKKTTEPLRGKLTKYSTVVYNRQMSLVNKIFIDDVITKHVN